MSPEKEKQLYEKYPMLYAQRDMDMRETCMCWGVETGDGWFDLIDKLSAALEQINHELPQGTEKIETVQVKSKFGGLRFYLDGVPLLISDKVSKLVTLAEEESLKTCERCGKHGKPNESGWITTLCEDCRPTI